MPSPELFNPNIACYLSATNEVLLQRDWLDRIRTILAQQGIEEFQRFDVDARFDWDALQQEAGSLSLFASQKCLILAFTKASPGREGSAWLKQFVQQPLEGVYLLLLMPALDRTVRKAAWLQAISQYGQVLEPKAPDARTMPGWLQQRAQDKGLKLTQEAAEWLLYQTEGNLLASDQELEKCLLLELEGEVSREQLEQVLSDQARFSPYALAEACLQGQAQRAIRILQHLRQEGSQVLALLWPLHRDLARLQQLQVAMQNGHSIASASQKLGIWQTQQRWYQHCLNQLNTRQLARALQQCAYLDRCAKGMEAEIDDTRLWDEMLELLKIYTGLRPVM